MDCKQLQEAFEYSSGKLIWKISRGRAKVGDALGCLHKSGYRSTMLNKKNYMVHRLIWQFHNGVIPDGVEIDHIDDNKDNNKIENLRLVTASENCRDRDNHAKGASWHKTLKVWIASIRNNGKPKYLGSFNCETKAHLAYLCARNERGSQ